MLARQTCRSEKLAYERKLRRKLELALVAQRIILKQQARLAAPLLKWELTEA